MNNVSHTDSIFNDNLDTKPRAKGGRPRKQPIAPIFSGFPTFIAECDYFNIPAAFMDIIAAIDNLAELKVVLYILRHTWGFREYTTYKKITIDEFMYGRKKRDGSRMDHGTGLSKSAVSDGLERAIKHGFVECLIDNRDRARVKHYFRMKVQSEEVAGPEFEEETTEVSTDQEYEETYVDQLEPDYSQDEYPEDYDPYANTIFPPSYRTPEQQKIFASEPELITPVMGVNNSNDCPNEMERTENERKNQPLRTKDIRKSPSLNLEEAIRYLPDPDQLPKPKAKSPAFIRNMIQDFSRDLGDHEHVPSNIAQAAKLYRNSGMSEEAFMQALYEARTTAKKATQVRHLNSQGNPNRMPYFYRVLAGLCKPPVQV